MLAPPPRTASGRRVYDVTDLRILVFIRRSREFGFSLDKFARCYGLADLRKGLVVRFAKSPRTILTTFERSFAI